MECSRPFPSFWPIVGYFIVFFPRKKSALAARMESFWPFLAPQYAKDLSFFQIRIIGFELVFKFSFLEKSCRKYLLALAPRGAQGHQSGALETCPSWAPVLKIKQKPCRPPLCISKLLNFFLKGVALLSKSRSPTLLVWRGLFFYNVACFASDDTTGPSYICVIQRNTILWPT